MSYYNQLAHDQQENVERMIQRCLSKNIFNFEDKNAHRERLAYCLLQVNVIDACKQDGSALVQYLHKNKPYTFYLSISGQIVN